MWKKRKSSEKATEKSKSRGENVKKRKSHPREEDKVCGKIGLKKADWQNANLLFSLYTSNLNFESKNATVFYSGWIPIGNQVVKSKD